MDSGLSHRLNGMLAENNTAYCLRFGGTIYSSLIALIIAVILGLCIAIWLTQQLLPEKLEWILKTIIELLASIPSVVFGLWASLW